jgi:hypothetical protein
MTEDPGPFQFGRAPENAMLAGIAGLACLLLSCCIGGGLSWLGLSFLACPFMLLSIVGGILGMVFGRSALSAIEAGTLPEALAGRAKTGYYTSIVTLALWALQIILMVVMLILVFAFGIGAGILGSM